MSNLIYVLALVAGIWVIYDVWAKNKTLTDGAKLVWTIFALFFSIITAIVYFLMKKK